MSNRHLARSIALQTLFEWDFRGQPTAGLPAILDHNLTEFGIGLTTEKKFAKELIDAVVDNLTDIDTLITKYAPDWPVNQITIVDRNILRLGVYELLHTSDIPPKVTINEAVELAKRFGDEESSKFVNGILDAIHKAHARPSETAHGDVPSQPPASTGNPS